MYGDNGPPAPYGLDYVGRATYLAWTQAVARQGGLAVELPEQATIGGQSLAGVLGERYPHTVITAKGFGAPLVWTMGQQYGYYLAPAKVRALDALHQAENQAIIAAGKAAGYGEAIAKGLALTGIVAAVGLVVVVALMVRAARPTRTG